eukprot:12895348-Alexandrium_andersonii.AAC.1
MPIPRWPTCCKASRWSPRHLPLRRSASQIMSSAFKACCAHGQGQPSEWKCRAQGESSPLSQEQVMGDIPLTRSCPTTAWL